MKNRMTEKSRASDDDKSPEMKQEMPPEKPDEVKVFGWRFNKAVFVTHINIFLYSTCFWIQTGTLPVFILYSHRLTGRELCRRCFFCIKKNTACQNIGHRLEDHDASLHD